MGQGHLKDDAAGRSSRILVRSLSQVSGFSTYGSQPTDSRRREREFVHLFSRAVRLHPGPSTQDKVRLRCCHSLSLQNVPGLGVEPGPSELQSDAFPTGLSRLWLQYPAKFLSIEHVQHRAGSFLSFSPRLPAKIPRYIRARIDLVRQRLH